VLFLLGLQSYEKSSEKPNSFELFRDEVTYPKLRKKVDFKKHSWRINVESSQIKGNQGKNEEVQFWAECKFGRNKEVVRFLIRNPRDGLESQLNFVNRIGKMGHNDASLTTRF